jgi:hypothetical protein
MNKLTAIKEKLNGEEYPLTVSDGMQAYCADNGIVIVFGQSDDLMEFNGAIDDEIGAYEGGVIYINDKQLDHTEGLKIEALWCDGDIAWTYKTEIPHETFDIMEDGEVFCKGIIFEFPKPTIYDHLVEGGAEAWAEYITRDKFTNEACNICIAKDNNILCLKMSCKDAILAHINSEWKG